MKLEVRIETGGSAPAGIDLKEIESDIQAQLDRLASETGVKRAGEEKGPAPKNAQGIDQFLAWTIELLQDPKMAKAYASATIFAINQILKSRGVPEETDAKIPEREKLRATVKLLGKEIQLPVATAAIGKLLEDMFGE